MLDGEMSDAERARLADLLRDNPQAQQVYLDFCWTHALLRRELGVYGEIPFSAAGFSPPSEVYGDSHLNGGVRDIMSSELRTPNPEPPFPTLSTTHYPLPATPFVGSWAFSCMVSAVIMGVAMLGAWAIKVTPHQHIAEAPSQSAPSETMPKMVFVGRITGMLDVKWSDDPRYLPPLGFAHVPLGRKYILDSGLMEITYDSGAKVILEGPCTYEVESTAGGYLALGKLTARVEKKRSEVRGQKSDPSPLSPLPSPLFSVRTPIALITDLGTEFGVEVDHSGGTQSHVFRGKVKVAVLADGGNEGARREVILGENESARVERAEDRLVIVRVAASEKTDRFVRAMPRPKPAVPVRIVETFDGVELGAAFEQMPPGRYAIRQGAAEHPRQEPFTLGGRQSRGYIRTVMADFRDRNFVFEATFHVRLDGPAHEAGPHHIFFGLGDGVPNANFWDVVTCGLVMSFNVDNGQALVARCDPESDLNRVVFGNLGGTVTEVVPLGGLGPGRHRFRLTKTGRCVKFAVDADFKGEFQQDFVSRPIDLPTAVPLLDATNSRLLVGTGNCDVMTVRFEELSVTYSEVEGR